MLAFILCSLGCAPPQEARDALHTLLDLAENNHSHVLAFSRDGRYLARGDSTGAIKVYDSLHGFSQVTFAPHRGAVSGLSFNRSNKELLSGCHLIGRGYGGDLRLDFIDGEPSVQVDAEDRNGAGWVGYSSICEQVISIPIPGMTIRFHDPDTLGLLAAIRVSTTNRAESVRRACIARDGEILALLTSHDRVIIWNLQDRRVVREMPGSRCLAMSPDGSSRASVTKESADRDVLTIDVLSLPDGKLRCRGRAPQSRSGSIAFFANGQFLISGGASSQSLKGELNIWQVPSGALIRKLHPFEEAVVVVTASEGGDIIAVGGDEGRLIVCRSSELLGKLNGSGPIDPNTRD